ncbi:TonB-dependent receptor domain-containing protein [Novosphingobium sp. NBM11]|uniref:TonB-dependent receptor domain-containing protein n=1 Tax=Novosphingobium sp. NBM11 TaxID=2596914 RepID=UPI0021029905|nr:TonB-dependent receptor [Novosphingobium sp. NBM11]
MSALPNSPRRIRRSRWPIGATSACFRLKGGYHFSPYEGFANQAMDMVSNTSWFLNFGYEGEFDWGSAKFTADYRDTDHEMNFLKDKMPANMPMNTEVHTFSTALRLEFPVSRHETLRLGGEYHHQWLNDYWPPVAGSMMMGPNTYLNVNAAHRNRLGAFAEWERHWSDRLSSVVGVRLDHVTMNTGNVQPYSTSMMNMDDAMAAMAFNAVSHARKNDNWSASALLSYAPASGVRSNWAMPTRRARPTSTSATPGAGARCPAG